MRVVHDDGVPITAHDKGSMMPAVSLIRLDIGSQRRVRPEQGHPREYAYQRLMQVSFQHEYYNAADHRCSDFSVYPTPSTAKRIHSLGLIFKEEPAGFSILYNEKLRTELINYLTRVQDDPVGMRVLSFALAVTNPDFVTFTRIPISMNPLRRNFYFSNRWAHLDGQDAILNQGDYVHTIRKADQTPDNNPDRVNYLRVIPSQHAVSVSDKVGEVKVRDIAEYPVACVPRCIPMALAKQGNPLSITCESLSAFLKDHPEHDCAKNPECKHASDPDQPCCFCRDKVLLDFSLLPQGRYSIDKVAKQVQQTSRNGRPSVVYTRSDPTPICFIDLLFSKMKHLESDESESGVYPVSNLDAPDPPGVEIKPVHYRLRFKNRATTWRYFIIPKTPSAIFDSLHIEAKGKPQPDVTFGPAQLVPLPNGQEAYRIESTGPIPLQEQSKYHLQLKLKEPQSGSPRVIIDYLPVASADRVMLLPEDSLPPYDLEDHELSENRLCTKPYSEIYTYI